MPMYSPVLNERISFGDAARFSAEAFNKALNIANKEYRTGKLAEYNIANRVVRLTGDYLKEKLGPSANTASQMGTNPGAGSLIYEKCD